MDILFGESGKVKVKIPKDLSDDTRLIKALNGGTIFMKSENELSLTSFKNKPQIKSKNFSTSAQAPSAFN